MARLHRDLFETLLSEIVAGDRQAGDMLPKEVDLAEGFQVSRGVAREAVRALQERGLITVKHGKGAIVQPEDRWDVFSPDVLTAALRSPRGLDLMGAYLESRRLLEVPAACLAAERASDSEKAAIRDAYQLMEQYAARRAPQPEDLFHQADQQFHQALVRATGNAALAQMVERIHSALFAARFSPLTTRQRFDRAMREHAAILAAVEASDPAAAGGAMERHLTSVSEDLAVERLHQAST